jgi:hypothetical protein
MVLKIDMANAFHGFWDSLHFVVLRKFGFTSYFIDWIKECMACPYIAPLSMAYSTPSSRDLEVSINIFSSH